MRLNQGSEHLDELYRTNYYWYLGSPEYAEAYLQPLAEMTVGDCVLDIGCGEGWLAKYAECWRYIGFDASQEAITRAEHAFRNSRGVRFFVARFEDPPFLGDGAIDTIVFGGILDVLIEPKRRLEFVEMYIQRFRPRRFIVYDLERLNTKPIDAKYRRVATCRGHVELPPEGPPAKWDRKVIAYDVS